MALIGTSDVIRRLREDCDHAAGSDAKVLITGESGVGKEVAARLIHSRSARAGTQMVSINCAGLTDTLLESELFGHVKGSFTGAWRDRPGLLETGDRGTVLLDEVGEMTLRMQGLLLRFLERGELQRVGSDRPDLRVDVRVMAATNRDLPAMVADKTFRCDLFYRLNVIHLHVAPLRERREDVPLLLDHFGREYATQYGAPLPAFAPDALARLEAYAWPGNVRELRNLVERLVVRRRELVRAQDLRLDGASEAVTEPVAGRASTVDTLLERLTEQRESFWSVAYDPFMLRDLTREDLRLLVRRGLQQTRGSYAQLVDLFNMAPGDMNRFLSFLRKHQCLPAAARVGVPGFKGVAGAGRDFAARERRVV